MCDGALTYGTGYDDGRGSCGAVTATPSAERTDDAGATPPDHNTASTQCSAMMKSRNASQVRAYRVSGNQLTPLSQQTGQRPTCRDRRRFNERVNAHGHGSGWWQLPHRCRAPFWRLRTGRRPIRCSIAGPKRSTTTVWRCSCRNSVTIGIAPQRDVILTGIATTTATAATTAKRCCGGHRVVVISTRSLPKTLSRPRLTLSA